MIFGLEVAKATSRGFAAEPIPCMVSRSEPLAVVSFFTDNAYE